MRALAQYIIRGRMQAMLVAVAMAILSLIMPPKNYLSSALIGLDTLRRGWQEGLILIAGPGAVMEGGKTPERLRELLAQAAPHMTGTAVAALLLGLILSVWLARWWQALLY